LPPVVADLDAELDRFAKLGVDELRTLWREQQGQEPPAALSVRAARIATIFEALGTKARGARYRVVVVRPSTTYTFSPT